MRFTNRIITASILTLLVCAGIFVSFRASANPDTPGAFVLGAAMKESVRIEAEADLHIILTSDANINGINILKYKEGIKDFGRPGFVRVTGASMEVVVDIEKSFLESEVASGLIKIYDFDLNEDGAGNIVNILPDSSKNSFLVLIGAKVDTPEGVQEKYFGSNVLSVNYL